jgi:hypothetical protein
MTQEHPHLGTPDDTIAALSTDPGPYAIPITAPLRAADRRILFTLKHDRGSLERLRSYPHVALVVLGKGNLAFTARGRAHIVQEAILHDPEFAAVSIEVIDDHRLKDRYVTGGVGWDSSSQPNTRFLRAHLDELREIAAGMVERAT